MINLGTGLGVTKGANLGGGSTPYAATLMDNQTTANLRKTGGFTGTPTAITYSAWVNPQTLNANNYLVDFTSRFRIFISTVDLFFQVWDSAGTFIYNRNAAHGMSVGTKYHVYGTMDLSANEGIVSIDDTEIINFAPNANNGTLSTGVNLGVFAANGGGTVFDTHFQDAMIFSERVAVADLYNSGEPPNPSTLGATPTALVGGSGYDATDANAGTNAGSGADFDIVTGTFANV